MFCIFQFIEMSFPDVPAAAQTKGSKTSGFNPCRGGRCSRPAVRPLVNTGAMVFVVFGLLGLNRSEHGDNHVIGDLVRAANGVSAAEDVKGK